jgi:peroxiredoxin Q/BCP
VAVYGGSAKRRQQFMYSKALGTVLKTLVWGCRVKNLMGATLFLMAQVVLHSGAAHALAESKAELKVGDAAPAVHLKTDGGADFDLTSRKGRWTVLYFYPKAETPGCTKQACSFRDKIQGIRDLGADVFGVSADDVEALKNFKSHHKLNFVLLADPQHAAIGAYGTQMQGRPLSKRWTFIIDPTLKIASVDKDVDPVLDAERVASKIRELKGKK